MPATVCVGFATRGRPAVLARAIEHLRQQTHAPVAVIICCTGPADVGDLAGRDGLTILYEQPGLPRQRNAILAHLPPGTEVVAFFDDDFFPGSAWLEAVALCFAEHPDVAVVTGRVVADGILGPGLSPEAALQRLREPIAPGPEWVEPFSPYGCNMAFRVAAIGQNRFDERLVLYGWLEDRDFGASVVRAGGRMIKLGAAIGVHCGIKSGRTSGKRLGYSQVMNPAYMRRKGTITVRDALTQVWRNVAANGGKSLRPEPYIDRRGRLLGNLLAFADLLRGRLTPERAERL